MHAGWNFDLAVPARPVRGRHEEVACDDHSADGSRLQVLYEAESDLSDRIDALLSSAGVFYGRRVLQGKWPILDCVDMLFLCFSMCVVFGYFLLVSSGVRLCSGLHAGLSVERSEV